MLKTKSFKMQYLS